MEFYKGYIPTRNKKALEKYKDNPANFLSYERARKLDEFAGVLDEEVVLIDVDNQDTSDILLKILDALDIKAPVILTSRGKHFLFKSPDLPSNKINTSTAIGIKVDIKLGSKNSYQVLKIGGSKRPWIRKSDSLPDLPKWLYPVKNPVDFSQLEEGDGRNQALFNYILTLQNAGFSKTGIIETIQIINRFVLKTPLEQREIDTILRDEAFAKPVFYKKGTFLHHDFAKYLAREEHLVKINQVLHVYRNGIYSNKLSHIEGAMIKHLPELNQAKRRETLAYLDLIADDADMAPASYIALGNGIYNLETDELSKYDPDIVMKNRIPVNYEPTAYDQTVDRTLTKICCEDPELRMLMEEMIGYLLMRRNELGKCFILVGSGSNGKSSFIDALKYFLKPENYSALDLEEIGHRFKTAELFGKLANLGDDISNKYIEETALFKKLVTGETVNVERKGEHPFEFDNYAKLIFSANDMPRINDLSDGLKRRLVIVPFYAKFKETDPDFDPQITDKLQSPAAMQYLLNIGLAGLKRVLACNRFTMPASVKQALDQYELDNNPLLAFLDERPKIANELVKDVYLKYDVWCRQANLKPLSRPVFGREIAKHGFKSKPVTINGESHRMYFTDRV